jgi:LysM repeat protein
MMKKRLFFFLFFLSGILLSGNLKAQEVVERSSQITLIGGKEYYMHHVKQGQTLYSLSKVYNVSTEEIERLNPEAKNGLKVGLVLGIPVRPVQVMDEEEPQPELDDIVPELDSDEDEFELETEIEQEHVAVEPEPELEEDEETPVEVEPEPVVEQTNVAETPVVEEPQSENNAFFDGTTRIVQQGEDLYDIAKEFGIDLADFKAINSGLTNEPKAGTRIIIPNVLNENNYLVHSCERNERVSSLLKRWKVDENSFRTKNISVGSHVFVNQVVLIPIQPITDFYWLRQTSTEVVDVIDNPVEPDTDHKDVQLSFDFETDDIPDCVAAPENASKRYRVALMVPLYLYDIANIPVSKEKANKAKKSRSLSFLQFYEGFMIAAETMEKQGMKLDLTVIDVTENVSSAEKALSQIENKDWDLIVGPFFGKSFEVIEEYAKAHGIAVVNPLSTRKSVIEDSPNVVKAKAGDIGMILTISNLVKNHYSDANVFIVSREKDTDTVFLNQLEHHLNYAVNDEVTVSGDEFLQFARNESERLEMGSHMVPTIDVEGQVYSTRDFQNDATKNVVLANSVKRYPYSEIAKVKSQLSGVRDNVIIAYGEENVFATQMLNSLTKSADRFPITLVCAPDWQKHEKLLVDNLLKMNAIFISDFFVDYNDDAAKRFVLRFRQKYVTEPQQYAFEGYDVGCYFLNVLMQYGSEDLINCLHCYQASMLHTNYRFYYKNYLNAAGNEGKENLYWSIYQYDKENIELVPVDPFKKPNADE